MKRCCNLLLGYQVHPKSPNSIVLVSPYHRIIGLSDERVQIGHSVYNAVLFGKMIRIRFRNQCRHRGPTIEPIPKMYIK